MAKLRSITGCASRLMLSFVGLILIGGCGQAPVTSEVGDTATQPAPVVIVVDREASKSSTATSPPEIAEQPSDTAEQPLPQAESNDYRQRVNEWLQTAAQNKQWLTQQMNDAAASAMESGGDGAAAAAQWATATYESLKQQGLTTAGSTREWLSNDWNAMGAWQYKVVQLEPDADIETALNELGQKNWECFHVQTAGSTVAGSPATIQFFLKRPGKSFLRHIPLKDLMYLLPMVNDPGSQ